FLVWVDQRLSTVVLGLLIIGYALFGLAQPSLSLPPSFERPLRIPVGFLNGFLTGLTGSQVLPLIPYVLALHIDTDRTVQAINLAITITSTFLLVGLYQSGVMSLPSLGLSLGAVLPAMAGIHVGTKARSFIPVQHFRIVVQIVLGLLGFLLVAKQVLWA
ncbi:MAG TPA: sulfite exporter TauE/SafE family protein, partial [Chloroflexota bacterium]|nr:sulfite exporter TauE/SafE family protein [Chloroflexota bacterium]